MSTTKIILAMIAGGVAGGIAAILLAPQDGATTRRQIFGNTDGNDADSVTQGTNSFTGWLEMIPAASGADSTQEPGHDIAGLRSGVL